MFWGRMLMHCLNGLILGTDALLVGWFTGMNSVGNTVRIAGGDSFVFIAEPCSSLANISLAILCWVLFTQSRDLRWSLAGAGWCLIACLFVVAVNVTRIGLIVLHPDSYDLIHGPAGAAVASWLSFAAVVGISAYGTRNGRLAHA